MLRKQTLTIISLLLLFSACTNEQAADPLDVALRQSLERLAPDGRLEHFQVPHHENLAGIPAGIGNPLTPEKVALGKLLFFETALAVDARYEGGLGTYSCATCHVPAAGFMPGRKQGIADGAWGFGFTGESRDLHPSYLEGEIDAQGARPLSVIGVAYVTNSMWAGQFGARFNNEGTEDVWGTTISATEVNHTGLDGLEAQNIEGTVTHRMRADSYVLDTLGYRALFDEAFPDWPVNARYGREAMSFALSAYIRNLMPYEAPFQAWLRGDHAAMTDQQKRGARLFFGKAGCYRCHDGPVLNNNEFHALGVNDLYQVGGLATNHFDIRNLGRGGFTQRQEDLYKFKVPQLYNLRDAHFYFHGSSHYSLRSVVEYFNAGVHENDYIPEDKISPYFHPLNLSEAEVNDLTEFLANGLFDPNLDRYVPERVLSGNCFPNNDPISRQQLGCE